MASKGITNFALDETPIAIIDFETTGWTTGIDRVVEVSVVRLDPGEEPRIVFDSLINPMRPMAATEIHGLTDQDVANAPQFADIVGELLGALSGCVIAAYNVYFDMRFLSYELDNAGVFHEPPHFCVMRLRKMLGLGAVCKLEEACRLHNVVHQRSHAAASDALASGFLLAKFLETARGLGIRTFGDLTRFKRRHKYKFLRSFANDPFPVPTGLARPSDQQQTQAAAQKVGVFDQTRHAIAEYWDAVSEMITDLEITERKIEELRAAQDRLGLTVEHVRWVHAKAFASVISQLGEDRSVDDRTTRRLEKLYDSMSKLGWAPGEGIAGPSHVERKSPPRRENTQVVEPDDTFVIKCDNCQTRLKGERRFAGRQAKCPRCGVVIQVPSAPKLVSAAAGIPPATVRQKEFARFLGIAFPTDINRREISLLIDEAPASERQREFARSLGINIPMDINRREISALIDEALTDETASVAPTSQGQIIVALTGAAHFRSIQQAIDAASSGDTVVVKPGVYREALILDKPLNLLGDGAVRDIVIECETDSCLVVDTTRTFVKGVTFRCRATDENHNRAGVINYGELRIEDCDIQALGPCVFVSGIAAKATICQCRLHDSKTGGILVGENGRATIENCDVFENQGAGVFSADGARVIVDKCRIYGSLESGVLVGETGRAKIEDCDIFHNQQAGVATSGRVIVRKCKIYGNIEFGVSVHNAGRAAIEDCEISGNKGAGVATTDDGKVIVRRSRIHGGGSQGVFVLKSRAIVEDCEIFDNKSLGIGVSDGGKTILRNSQIHGSPDCVGVFANGRASIVACEISESTNSGVIVDHGRVSIEDSRIFQHKMAGVTVVNEAKATLLRCQIYASQEHVGLQVGREGTAMIKDCRIFENKIVGVLVAENGTATIKDCDIYQNSLAGVDVEEEGYATILRCEIHDNQVHMGVQVARNGNATIKDCCIFRNKAAGVHVCLNGQATIQRCQIGSSIESHGVCVQEKGIATISGCDIFENKSNGIYVGSEAEATIHKCQIHGCLEGGIEVTTKGRATIEYCDIFKNAMFGIQISEAGESSAHKTSVNGNGGFGVCVGEGCKALVTDCDCQDNMRGPHSIDKGSNVEWDGTPLKLDAKKDIEPSPNAV